MKSSQLTYHRAASLDDAAAIARGSQGFPKFMAGGQSLMPMLNLRLAMSDDVIDIAGIAALRESRRVGDTLSIGAAVTHAMIEDGKVEDPARGYLQYVARGIAYRSVRNKGTIGGSLVHADPAADWPTALFALDAVMVIQAGEATREVPVAEFQLGIMETAVADQEILRSVLLPVLSAQARWSYVKFNRKAGEFAHSLGAVVVDPERGMANVVSGASADKPFRLARASERLARGLSAQDARGQAFQKLVEQDLADATSHEPGSYEFHLHQTIVVRAVAEAMSK